MGLSTSKTWTGTLSLKGGTPVVFLDDPFAALEVCGLVALVFAEHRFGNPLAALAIALLDQAKISPVQKEDPALPACSIFLKSDLVNWATMLSTAPAARRSDWMDVL